MKILQGFYHTVLTCDNHFCHFNITFIKRLVNHAYLHVVYPTVNISETQNQVYGSVLFDEYVITSLFLEPHKGYCFISEGALGILSFPISLRRRSQTNLLNDVPRLIAPSEKKIW